jgi:glutamate synthase (NADPH/NADH) small chain
MGPRRALPRGGRDGAHGAGFGWPRSRQDLSPSRYAAGQPLQGAGGSAAQGLENETMGKVTGFLEYDRQEQKYQLAGDRVRHFREFTLPLDDKDLQKQAARCMDCGIPFCHGPTGCPVHNQIPDWNDLVYNDDWEEAARNLHSTNNFPEFTGRVCPAPCEEACTLNLENVPVTIKTIEQSIADKAWEMGWIRPEPPARLTGKSVAIVGSGPAGLAAAQQLARVGHEVHVYEREPRAGGLLRYGIPDFKMEKHHIDRRVAQMEAEGVVFHYGVNIGVDKPFDELVKSYDAVLMCGGAERPRDPQIPGMDLDGVHFAMPFLVQQNRRNGRENFLDDAPILAGGKDVVVIGGGDTASDCIGTAFRQGALSVTQLDIRPKPPEMEDKLTVWPYWPTKLRTSSSQAEGAEREFQVATLAIEGKKGRVTGVRCARVDEKRVPIPGTEFVLKADLVFIAIGFAGPVHEGMLHQAGVALDKRGNVAASDRDYRTSQEKVFSAGDMRRGQSLVVWAIREGRQAARAIDEYLMGSSVLPR